MDNPIKILLIDDDPDFIRNIKIILESSSYEVIAGDSQEEGERLIEETMPDLCIFDLMLEHYDSGFILCHHLKRRNPDIPVILITSSTSETGLKFHAETESERRWLKANSVMDKMIRPDQLISEINKLLRK